MAVAEKTGFTAEELRQLGEGPEGEIEAEVEETAAEETEVEETTEAAATEETTTTAKTDTSKAPQPKGDLSVALREEREKRQALAEKLSRMEGAFEHFVKQANAPRQEQQQRKPEEAIPDYNTDPIGHLNAQLAATVRELNAIKGQQQQFSQREVEQGRANEMMNRYASSVRDFAKETTDYDAAYQHLAKSRDEELKTLGFTDPAERTNRMQYEEGLIVGRALMSGQNPAQILYEAAKLRGYAKAQPKPAESKIVTLAKGQQAAKTLSTAKGGDSDAMTLERLSELMEEDPDAADKMWSKMARMGKLG